MDGITITVRPEDLISLSAKIAEKSKQMKENSDDMRSIMSQTAEFWIGDAGDFHRTMFEEHIQKLDKTISRLMAQSKKLQEISGNYIETVSDTTALIEELPGNFLK